MLSRILSPEQCAECRFCCSFIRTSTWETPLFTEEQIHKLQEEYGNIKTKLVNTMYTLDLADSYVTDLENEEAACPFLNAETGCILPDKNKPFDCKIWPLRIMHKDKELVIALTPTCPSINKLPLDKVKHLVIEEGLGTLIYRQAEIMPEIIKDYKENYPILMTRLL